MNKQRFAILAAIGLVLAAAMVVLLPKNVVAPDPSVNLPQKPGGTALGTVIHLQLSGSATFEDGLAVSLVSIDDSRCKEGVVCVWEGELSANLRVSGGSITGVSKEVRLAGSTARSVTVDGYSLMLREATETGIDVLVEKSALGDADNASVIQVAGPLPNAVVASPLVVTGRARGTWYFEASFPVKLFDANNVELATGVAQAQGDWMTENFVPFTVTLVYPTPATATGTLVLYKDNPSGLPENDASVSVPVTF